MRSTRALFVGAALAATMTLAGPAIAHADPADPGGRDAYSNGQETSDDGFGTADSWQAQPGDSPVKGAEGGLDGPPREGRDGGPGGGREGGREGGGWHGHGGWHHGHGHGHGGRGGGWHGPSRDGREGGGREGGGREGGGQERRNVAGPEQSTPRGGVHTGGGGMAATSGGLAAGGVLLLGGLGAGAYALRRRTAARSA